MDGLPVNNEALLDGPHLQAEPVNSVVDSLPVNNIVDGLLVNNVVNGLPATNETLIDGSAYAKRTSKQCCYNCTCVNC